MASQRSWERSAWNHLRLAWLRKYGARAVRAVIASLDVETLLDQRWTLIRNEVEEAIIQYAKMIDGEQKHRSDFNPRLIVYSLGETATSNCLGSGYYHFYRGALTHDGMVIADLATHILQVLHELGAYNEEVYKKSLEGMSELIAGSG